MNSSNLPRNLLGSLRLGTLSYTPEMCRTRKRIAPIALLGVSKDDARKYSRLRPNTDELIGSNHVKGCLIHGSRWRNKIAEQSGRELNFTVSLCSIYEAVFSSELNVRNISTLTLHRGQVANGRVVPRRSCAAPRRTDEINSEFRI